ncbi:MAG: hypothetical protein AAB364_02510 [Patescibacteria group bacterium]
MIKKLLLVLVLVTLVVTGTVYAQTTETRPSFFQNLISWLWPATPAATQVAAVSAAKPAVPNPLVAQLTAARDKAKGPAKVDPTKAPTNPNKLTIKAGSKKTTNKAGTVISGKANSSGVAPATPVLEITQISGPSLVFTNQNNFWYSWTNINTVTSASVEWGDGTQTSGQVNQWGVSFQHTYTHSGTYTATFYSSDVNGNQAQVSVAVSVTGAPTVTAQPNPTLALTYDSNQQESALTATYNVDITAGAEGVVLPPGFIIQVYPYVESNNCTVPGLPDYHFCSSWPRSGTTTPDISQGLSIPAGTTQTFRIVANFNPQVMFGGSYSSVLWSMAFCPSNGWCQWITLTNSPAISNSLAVFGERAPYITSAAVLGCLPPAEKCYLQIIGTRFPASGNTIKVYNRQTGALVSQTNENPVVGGDGTTIYHSMIEPVSGRPYPAGFYSVQVVSPTTGASNMVGFEMKGVTGAQIYTAISPSSPAARTVTTSATTVTENVVLGVFRLLSNNGASTVTGLGLALDPTVAGKKLTNIRLVDGTNIYGASSVGCPCDPVSGAIVADFTNLKIFLEPGRDITFKADIVAGADNVSLSPTLLASRIVGIDSNFNNLDISNASNVTANGVTFSLNNVPIPVLPILSVNLPRGGEVWPIGSVREINWSHLGQSYSPGRYKVYASTQSGSWYGLINDTGEKSLNWTVGRVTVNGVVKTLAPGNYWVQVIDSLAPVSAAGRSSVQAFSLGSVSLTAGVITTTPPVVNPTPPIPTVPAPTVPPVVTPTPTPPAPAPVPAPVPVSTISIDRPRAGDSWRLGEQRNIEWQDSRSGNYSYTVYIATPSDGANRVNLRQIAVVNEKKLRWTVGQNLTANPVTPGSYVIVVVSSTNPEYNSAVSVPFNIVASNHAYLSGGNQTASASDSLGSWLYGMFPNLFSY